MNRRLLLASLALTVVVAAAVLLLARPWESEGGTSDGPDFGDAELVLQDPDNRRRLVTAEELVASFPLAIQLPAYVPDGYRLAMVTRFEGPPGIDRLSFANNLLAVYRGSGASGLSLEQRPGSGVGSTDVPTEPVEVRGAEGWYVFLDRGSGFQQLVWSRCGRVFMLMSSPRDAVSRDELLRVAESVGPEVCEPS